MSPVPIDFSELRRRELGERESRSPLAFGPSSLHRPDELLVDDRASTHIKARLLSEGCRPFVPQATTPGNGPHWRDQIGLPAERNDLNRSLAKVGATLWTLPRNSDVTEVVADLRATLDNLSDDPTLRSGVGPNHVYCGEGVYQGGPGGPPFTGHELSLATGPAPAGASVGLAVLDTGLPVGWESLHPALKDFVVADRNDPKDSFPTAAVDPVAGAGPVADVDRILATEAGHGIFITGLVHRVAPALIVDAGKVLDATGLGDDATVIAELVETPAQVICLSLGGYTLDDQPPIALLSAINMLGLQGRVVVAAAGNNSSARPFWPAAAKGVIAVAAFDTRGPDLAPADFSNFGSWVDVCAPGCDLLSTFGQGTWQTKPGEPTLKFDRWAGWSGTSFAAPLVAAEIARRVAEPTEQRSARRVALEFLSELDEAPWMGFGQLYQPPVRLTR